LEDKDGDRTGEETASDEVSGTLHKPQQQEAIEQIEKTTTDPYHVLNITLPLHPGITLTKQQALAATLATRLRVSRFILQRKHQPVYQSSLSAAEVAKICSLLFETVFALPGILRIRALFTEYRRPGIWADPEPSFKVFRALYKIEKRDIEPLICYFTESYRAYILLEKKRNSVTDCVKWLWYGYELYRIYLKLLGYAEGQGGIEVRAFLKARGFTTSPAVGWEECVHRYLRQILGITESDLKHFLEDPELVYLTSHCFGVGIIPLLPGNILE